MAGMSRIDGTALDGVEHIAQSVRDILGKPRVDLPCLPGPDLVDSGPHVVEDAALGHAAQHPERLRERVEQHLMGLEQIGSHNEGAATRQLGMGNLQLRGLAAQHGIILAPVELERLARLENQRHECPTPTDLKLILQFGSPSSGKSRNPVIRAIISQLYQIGVQLLGGPLLFAGLLGLHPQPSSQLVREGIEFARPDRNLEAGLNRVGTKILTDGVAGQAGPALDLPNGDLLPEMPTADHTE